VAIVGRANVGKSTLFNRLVGRQVAIVEDRPGITRDRLQEEAEWRGKYFLLVDTGGLGYPDGRLEEQVERQVQQAVRDADLLLFVVDGRQGITAEDEEVADWLRRQDRPVILVVNKVDGPEAEGRAWDFFRLGLGEPFPVSALHGRGTGDLLDRVLQEIGGGAEEEKAEAIRVAIVGRPNVGKSSLVNRLLGAERVVVSEVPGTTRDAVDVELVHEGQRFVLVDTAGIRRRSRIDTPTEYYGVRRALRAVERAQVVVLVLEAPVGVTSQDKRLAARVAEARKALLVVVNKWDLLDAGARRAYPALLERELAFVAWAPQLYVSALTRRRVAEVLPRVRAVFAASARRLPTAEVNRFFTEAVALTPPPQKSRKPAKLFYAAQVGVHPPTFVLFVARSECFTSAYLRHLEGRLREAYDFEGTPLRILVREKGSV